MSYQTKNYQNELRQRIFEAIQAKCITPAAVVGYLLDCGWEYTMPTKQTIINILREFGIEYIQGYWTKTK